jgi:hypothetical protein
VPLEQTEGLGRRGGEGAGEMFGVGDGASDRGLLHASGQGLGRRGIGAFWGGPGVSPQPQQPRRAHSQTPDASRQPITQIATRLLIKHMVSFRPVFCSDASTRTPGRRRGR